MKPRLRIFTFTLCIALLCGACATYYRNASRDLIQRSERLASVKGWWIEDVLDQPYTWLTNTTLLSHSGWWRLQKPSIYNVATHTKSPLNALEKLLGSDEDDATEFWQLSPDRRHIAWSIEFYNTVHTAALDGSEHRVWHVEGPGYGNCISDLEWLPDGHQWTASTYDYSSGADRESCIVDILDPTPKLAKITKAEAGALVHPAPRWDGASTPGRPAHWIGLTSSGSSKQSAAQAEPTMRDDSAPDEAEVSPDGKQVAWIGHAKSVAPWRRVLRDFASSIGEDPTYFAVLYISKSDGTNIHEVGRISLQNRDGPTLLQWMPDGRHVSYVYSDSVYSIDTESAQ